MKKLEIFEKECRRLSNLWELNDWTIRIHTDDTKKEEKHFEGGWIYRNLDNSQADIYLDEKYCKTENDIKQTAKHEMIHLMLAKLYLLGKWRWASEDEVDRTEEELVHKLEDILALPLKEE